MDSSPNGAGDEFATSMSFLGSSPYTKRFDQKSISNPSTGDAKVVLTTYSETDPNQHSPMVTRGGASDPDSDSLSVKSGTKILKQSDDKDVSSSFQLLHPDSSDGVICESPRAQAKGPTTLRVRLFSVSVF